MTKIIATIILLVSAFCLGVCSTTIYAELNQEQPLQTRDNASANSLTIKTVPDHIQESQIKVYSSRVVLDIDDPQWASFTPTGSMEPVLDHHSHAIEIIPQSAEEIEIGDICSYTSKYASGSIIHRVVHKGKDEKGTYFVFKGDNNPTSDPGRIRFDQVKRCVVAIIY